MLYERIMNVKNKEIRGGQKEGRGKKRIGMSKEKENRIEGRLDKRGDIW